ncbi:MAG TPA: transglutaminase-like domain-containing protein, partial [Candidatus Binatia bacterium]|nr:transglutaminase-like domain-containing protein [Candidatus Binatia bacterium]
LTHDPYREFRQTVERGADKIDLARAALTIALSDYPNLDIAGYLGRIDELAVEVTGCCSAGAGAAQQLAALNEVLFARHRFRGNSEDYYDPKNSFLNEVLDRRTGIPITLSILYIEVAQRVGLLLEGVGFPGHFLVRYGRTGSAVFIDPFDRGALKSRADLTEMLAKLFGRPVELTADCLRRCNKKEILRRMLGNLKAIYDKNSDLAKLLSVLDRIVILDPSAADDIRERARVYLRLECFAQARADLETYLRLAPDAADAQTVRDQLVSIARRVTVIH